MQPISAALSNMQLFSTGLYGDAYIYGSCGSRAHGNLFPILVLWSNRVIQFNDRFLLSAREETVDRWRSGITLLRRAKIPLLEFSTFPGTKIGTAIVFEDLLP